MLSSKKILQILQKFSLADGQNIAADRVNVQQNDQQVTLVIQCPQSIIASEAEKLHNEMLKTLQEAGESRPIHIALSAPHENPPADSLPEGQSPQPTRGQGLENICKIILIGSGKGGVGKSTVALNLAMALAQQNHAVGLLDADIYGPSMAQLLGVNQKPEIKDGKAVPLTLYGIQSISMSYLLDAQEAVVWRAPMVVKALNQFLFDVDWGHDIGGKLDYLLIDLPPGTGDIPLTLAQKARADGVIIVTTGHQLSFIDAARAITMFEKVTLPILGIVENMAGFSCPHCGTVSHIFDALDMQKIAKTQKTRLLAQIPLLIDIRQSADTQIPFMAFLDSKSPAHKKHARIFLDLAKNISLTLTKETRILNPQPQS